MGQFVQKRAVVHARREQVRAFVLRSRVVLEVGEEILFGRLPRSRKDFEQHCEQQLFPFAAASADRLQMRLAAVEATVSDRLGQKQQPCPILF